jgi:hypothetical protein
LREILLTMFFIEKNIRIKCGICLLYLIFVSQKSQGQVFIEIYTNLLKHFQDTVISLTSSENTIIRGIDNKVFVRSNLFQGKVNIQIDQKYILSRDENYLLLSSPSLDSKENLSLLIGNFKNDTIYYKIFRNESLPVPSIFIGHVNLSETKLLRLNELQMADSIFILFRNTLAGSSEWLKIKRFTIGYSYGSYYITHDNIGNILTQKTKRILLGMKPGQEVSLSILAEGTGEVKKEVPLLYFIIQ